MSLAKNLPAVILDTILVRLAGLFLAGAGGDLTAARQAAAHMLADYHPQTANELRLAAQIVSFSFHALEALNQTATPDLPLTRILRLRANAVSLNQQSEKAQRRLDQLQQASHESPVAAHPQPQPAQPEPTPNPIDTAPAAKPTSQTWTHADEQRQQEDLRIAASLQRAEARIAALSGAAPDSVIANRSGAPHTSQSAPS